MTTSRMMQFVRLALVVPLVWGAAAAARAETPASWTCLPEETVLLARIPGGLAFVEALRSQTKFGALLLNPERIQKILGIVREENEEEFGKMTKNLAEYGLKLEDLPQFVAGEVGYAVVVDLQELKKPGATGLAWFEPGGDLSDRIVKAIEKGVEEHKQDEHPVARLDIELAGQKVMQLAMPILDSEGGDAENEPIPDFQKPEELRKWLEERQKRIASAKKVVAGHNYVLVAQLGKRLLVANTFGGKPGEDEDGEESSAANLERAKGVFARFLTAHAEGGGKPLAVFETPGLADALPAGVPVVEVVVDPRPFLKLPENEDTAKVHRILKLLGVDRLGPLAIRQTLDKTLIRNGLFLSAPAPRNGIVSLLEQKALPAEPAAWVPADAIKYSHYSFDLGRLYSLVKELAIGEMGDAGRARFEQIEVQMQAMTQTDPVTLLSSLGSQHSIVEFTPKINANVGEEDDEPAISARTGIVWQVKDEELWKRLMNVVAPFTGQALVEEQGFTGLRVNQGAVNLGVFVGQGHLVVGIGEDITESLLSAVKNPPSGSAAMVSSAFAKRAAELLPPEPGMTYSVTDSARQTKILWETMIKSLESPARMLAQAQAQANVDVGADAEKLETLTRILGKIKSALPSDSELEGVMGVSVNQTVVDQDGLKSRGLTELPAP